MHKRAAELEAEAKKLRAAVEVSALIDADLAAWKTKLEQRAGGTGWDLLFVRRNDSLWSGITMAQTGPTLFLKDGCSSELWAERLREEPGFKICTAAKPMDVFPPPLAAKRLQLFGFSFVICPRNFKDSLTKLWHYQVKPYGYGRQQLVFSVHPDPIAGIAAPDMTDEKHVTIIYQHFAESMSGPDDVPFAAEIEHHKKKIAELEKQQEVVNSAWSQRLGKPKSCILCGIWNAGYKCSQCETSICGACLKAPRCACGHWTCIQCVQKCATCDDIMCSNTCAHRRVHE